MAKELKAQLLAHCIDFIDGKYQTLLSEYKLYQESAANETKSTAGDKHDTSKSMMQLEQEKLGQQLELLLRQRKILESIDATRRSQVVEFGSIVYTKAGNFFIAISAREVSIDSESFVPVSLQSPLAMALAKHKAGDVVEFNYKIYDISSVH